MIVKTQKKMLKLLNDAKFLISPILSPDKINALLKEIQQRELIIPIVGAFSSGKSTLINSFLQKDILPTNVTPETAIPTEIRYYNDEYIEAISKKGSIVKLDISQINSLKDNAKDYQYVKIYLNNENIKNIQPFVLVDMPGFNSPYDIHNQAMLSYLDRGVYFVILINVEEGTITKKIIREIENLLTIGKGFSFFLSKANLRSNEEINEIKVHIENILQDYFDLTINVEPIGIEGGKELYKILKSINPDKLFVELFNDKLKNLYFEIETSLNVKTSALQKSKKEIEEALKELDLSLENIEIKKQTIIEQIEDRYSNRGINQILNIIENELIQSKDYFVDLALKDKDLFQEEITSIIKNILIKELTENFNQISNDIINDLSLELSNLTYFNDFVSDGEFMENISNSIKIFLKTSQTGIEKLVDLSKNKRGELYKFITVILSFLTNILNPIIEIIIIFLPEILFYFTKKWQKEKIHSVFVGEVIPQIRIKLKSKLPVIYQEQISKLITAISNEFEKKIKEKQAEIKSIQDKKNKEIIDIDSEIEKFKRIKKEFQCLFGNFLKKLEV